MMVSATNKPMITQNSGFLLTVRQSRANIGRTSISNDMLTARSQSNGDALRSRIVVHYQTAFAAGTVLAQSSS